MLEYNSTLHVLHRHQTGSLHKGGEMLPLSNGRHRYLCHIDVTLWPFISEVALGGEVCTPAGLIGDELKMNEAGQLS